MTVAAITMAKTTEARVTISKTATTIPSFSRVEIRTRGKDDLNLAADALEKLAGELREAAREKKDETAVIVAHHRIKATSQQLRGK
jgi:hypothetical protein